MIIMVIRNWFGDVARGASKYLSITIRICNDRVKKAYDDKNKGSPPKGSIDNAGRRSLAIDRDNRPLSTSRHFSDSTETIPVRGFF